MLYSKLRRTVEALCSACRSRSVPPGPLFEALDERLCMAVVVWDGGPGGLGTVWTAPVNWAGDALPGPADEVVLGATGTNPTIVMGGTANVRSVTSTRNLTLTGSLTLGGTSNFAPGTTFTQSGGTLTGAGDLTLEGATVWSNGTMSGTGRTVVGAAGTLTMSGDGLTRILSRTLEIDGAASWTSGRWYFNNGSVQNDGTLSFNVTVNMSNLGGTNAFTNNGTVSKSGAGTTTISFPFTNTGTLNIDGTGKIVLSGGGSSPGDVNVGAGATLEIGGWEYYAMGGAVSMAGTLLAEAGGASFSGALTGAGALSGSLRFDSDVTFDGTVTLAQGHTIDGSGVVTFTGAVTWTGGDLEGTGRTVIAGAGTLTMSGDLSKRLSRELEIDGTGSWTGGRWYFDGGSVQNDGVFTVSDAAAIASEIDVDGIFLNMGTFTKSGPGVTKFLGVAFSNAGTMTVEEGTFEFYTGTQSMGGSVVIGSAGTIAMRSGGMIFNGSLTGAGTLVFDAGTVTVASNVDFPGVVLVNGATLTGTGTFTSSGQMTWAGGRMIGAGRTVIGAAGSLTITGGTLARVLEVDGAATWSAGTLSFDGGTIQNDGSFSVSGPVVADFDGHVNGVINNGVFTKSGPAGATLGILAFTNTGTLGVTGGWLTTGAIVNDGVLSLSKATTLTVGGDFTQSAGATLATEIAGPGLGQIGRLVVSSAAFLNGTLAATVVDGFSPALFARFEVVTASGVVGTFSSVDVSPPANPTRKWIASSDSVGVDLVYTSTADRNNDALVNSTDVSDFINSWFVDRLKGTLVTDFNGDGVSNSTDVSDFINQWFEDLSP